MEKPKHRSVMFSAETRIRLVPMQVSIVLSILFISGGR